MEMLNGIYYNSQNGECWTGDSGSSSSKNTCNFTQTSSGVKGLNTTAQGMIDKEIIWNLGGSSSYNNVTVSQFYERERGTTVYSNRPKEWNLGKQSIALPYASDYGYATSGGSTGRKTCFAKELYHWNSMKDCGNNDWLKPASGYMWTLSPYSSHSSYVFLVASDGYVNRDGAHFSLGVWPALYLSPSVSISGGTGTSSSPFQLTAG